MSLISREELMPRSIVRAAQDHAREEYIAGKDKPREAIGVISKGEYVPLKNVSETPDKKAYPDPERFYNMIADKEVDCVIHSHVNGRFYPSRNDMQSQINLEIPHGILACYKGSACTPVALWGDQLERLPLNDRSFQHGISDCYEAFRDWYRINRGYTGLFPIAREWLWWSNGEDMYMDNLEASGFVPIPAKEATVGDAVLFKMPVRSKVDGRLCVGETYNHAAVIQGPNTIYHHPSAGDGYSFGSRSGLGELHRRMSSNPLFLRLPAS